MGRKESVPVNRIDCVVTKVKPLNKIAAEVRQVLNALRLQDQLPDVDKELDQSEDR